jgi:hypothetical protein
MSTFGCTTSTQLVLICTQCTYTFVEGKANSAVNLNKNQTTNER